MKCKYCRKPITKSQVVSGDALDDAHIDCIQDTTRTDGDAYRRDDILTTAEVAAAVHVARTTVLAAIAVGKLPARKAGRDWLVNPADLEQWRASTKVGRPAKS